MYVSPRVWVVHAVPFMQNRCASLLFECLFWVIRALVRLEGGLGIVWVWEVSVIGGVCRENKAPRASFPDAGACSRSSGMCEPR